EGSGRIADVADVAGEDPTEVLPVEGPLDLAGGRLGEVDAAVVEEAHDHRLRVAGDQSDGDAALGPLGADLEAGDGDGGHLEIVDVDAAGVEPGHDRPLEHAGRPARVA